MRAGWGINVVLQACRKVVDRLNSGKPTDRLPSKLVTWDEFRTSCEQPPPSLHARSPSRSAAALPVVLSLEPTVEAPMRGLMWCPMVKQNTPRALGRWKDRDCNSALDLLRAGRLHGAQWSCAGGHTEQKHRP
ncbi:hypothetical protein QJQ45_007247 [Haematococcus lacustris]|nr:hypothetical protein QJQ45_007247 [Haematococcus lacustris]